MLFKTFETTEGTAVLVCDTMDYPAEDDEPVFALRLYGPEHTFVATFEGAEQRDAVFEKMGQLQVEETLAQLKKVSEGDDA